MTSKSLLVGVVGIAAVAAAGAGGYLALRMNASDMAVDAAPQAVTAVPVPSAVPENTPVTEPGPATARQPEPEVAPAPARRVMASDRPVTEIRRPSPAQETTRPEPAEPPATPAVAAPPTPIPAVETPPAGIAVIDTPVIPEAVKPQFEEVTIDEDAVIGIRLDQPVSSETARVEDRVTARVSRDVVVGGRTAVPSGARLEGVVTTVERGGKMRERARIGIRFNTLIMGDNTRVPIQTAVILREGESPTGEAGSKIGASAVVGAILGAVIGGKKGAAIGTAAGAAGGTAAVMAGDVNHATIPAGSVLTVRLTAPVTVLVERDQLRRP